MEPLKLNYMTKSFKRKINMTLCNPYLLQLCYQDSRCQQIHNISLPKFPFSVFLKKEYKSLVVV